MKSRSLYALLVLIIFSSLGLSSCQVAQAVQAQPNPGTFVPQSVVASDCSNGNHIRAIRAVDQNTVTFELCSPDRTFSAKVGMPAFSIQDDVVLSQTQGDPEKISQIANGTGPFRITKVTEVGLQLQRWVNYWGAPVRLDFITINWNGASEIRRKSISVRDVDGISAVNPGDVGTLLLDHYLKVEESPLVNTVFLGLNNTIAPFDNLQFRQALSYAFDRQKLADDLFSSSAQAADQLVPSAFSTGHSNSLTGYEYDAEKAKETLNQSGVDLGSTLTLSYDQTPGSLILNPDQLAEALAQYLKDIGLTIQLNPMATQDFEQSLSQGKLGLYFTAFSPDYPDANSFFETLFSQDNGRIGKTDPMVAEKIKASLGTDDLTAIQGDYDEINHWIKQQVPLIPLVYTNKLYAYRSVVDGIRNGAFGESFVQIAAPQKNLAFMQSNKPGWIWPVNFSQEDTLRVTRLVFDTLTSFDTAEIGVLPSLAETWTSNDDFTEWTFLLRYDVKFTDGKFLDANDVVATFAAQADRTNPNHRADLNYDYYRLFFGNFMK